METEIWIALISLGGLIWTSTVGYFLAHSRKQKAEVSSKDSKINQIRTEHAFERKAVNTFVNLQQWDTISSKIQTFCKTSSIDRFMILVAVNGLNDPRETTAIYQYREDTADFHSYVGVELDRDYVSRLAELKRNGILFVDTSELPSSLLRGIYLDEGVTHAIWYLIGTMENKETGQVAYKYCSFATSQEIITDETEHIIGNIVGELKKMMGNTSYSAC